MCIYKGNEDVSYLQEACVVNEVGVWHVSTQLVC